ncbi:hypothetical protein CLAFUW4_11967 [Fulvia fulva]|nr:hypothetical protein CLAFUR4_11972 [Fulvia fulva]WPV18531.1 hypothetical protein CLAFUW4_11967 [Fulvia fulva]
MHRRVNSLLSSLLPKETTTATMSAPGSPTMLPRWAKVDKFSSLSSTPKMIFAGAAAVLTLFLVLTLSQTQSSPLRSRTTSHSDQHDPIDDVFNSTLGFQKILVINMPSRSDLRDAMALAAGYTNLQVEFVDGVSIKPEDFNEMLLPAEHPEIEKYTDQSDMKKLKGRLGNLGSWRAHMNAIRTIVEQNLTSALILEADVDWDIRIHQQIKGFARALRLLVQPVKGTKDAFLDPTYPYAQEGQQFSEFEVDRHEVSAPSTSPFGDTDRWDMLWLGHCGVQFPNADNPNVHVPLGRAIINHDETVPEPQHIQREWGSSDLTDRYPAHTRVVSRARNNVCSLAYAFTQQGARNALWELGLRKMNSAFDIMLRDTCDGTSNRSMSTCLSVVPQLFQHHMPVGKTFSNIHGHAGGANKKAFTNNIRWSTKSNLKKLVVHDTDYIDLWPDAEDKKPE